MNKKDYLIIDLGASNGRAIVAHFHDGRFEMEVTHRFDNRPVFAAGTLYWDVLRLFSEVKIGLRKSRQLYPDLRSIGIDTWGCDFGFIDRQGKLVGNPVNYRDQKRHDLSSELYKVLSREELFKLSAGSTNEIMGIYQLFAYKYEACAELDSAHRFLMIPDLLNYFLTGRACNEFSDATMALVCDQVNRGWEPQIFQRIGIPDILFGEIVTPGTVIGNVQTDVCNELEMATLRVVAPASHDTASAVAGLPVGGGAAEWAFISMGTWCICGAETPAPIVNEITFASGYGNNGTIDGRNMLVKYITGLWIIQQCRERWIMEGKQNLTWDEIVHLAKSTDALVSFIDVDDPQFGSPSNDMPSVIAEYCRVTGQHAPSSVGQVARVVFESLAMKFRNNLESLEDITGRQIELLHLVGGGTRNRLLCQWTADAMNVHLIAGPTETTSVGNFLMQLEADNEIRDIDEGRAISLASAEVDSIEPHNSQWWNDSYRSFLSATGLQGRVSER